MSKELIEAFNDSIFENSLEIGLDFAEATIDSIIDNPLFEAIPLVKLVKTFYKGFITIRERSMLKKTACFLNQLHNQKLTQKQLEKYKKKIGSKRKLNAELERVLEILDRLIEIEKVAYLANLFVALVQEKISYELFKDYTELLDRLFMNDLRILVQSWANKDDENLVLVQKRDMRVFKRLSSQGLGEMVFIDTISGGDAEGVKENTSFNFHYDEYSQNFVNLGLFGKISLD